MTPTRATPEKFMSRPFRGTRPTSTLPLSWLMEETQRQEMGQRIAELRERSPYTQPDMAEKLGIGLRAYQKLEARGTTKFERCEEIAKIHSAWTGGQEDWQHVDANWIWGRAPKPAAVPKGTPDLSNGQLDADVQLAEVIARLDAIMRHLGVELAARSPSQAADVAEAEAARLARQTKRRKSA